MSRVDQNRYESSTEKINKLKKRNRYVEDKHNEMNIKFKEDAQTRIIKNDV
jgi:hypothetical protein